jgi:hypothetical protein
MPGSYVPEAVPEIQDNRNTESCIQTSCHGCIKMCTACSVFNLVRLLFPNCLKQLNTVDDIMPDK